MKLDGGFEFDIDAVTEAYDGQSKTSVLNIRCPLTGKDASAVRKHIIPDNTKHIIVKSEGEEIDEYTGYRDIVTIEKTITHFERTLNVRLRKEG